MTQPIGIFDSGVGGTSILREIQLLLPKEHLIYLADSKNAPYGQKKPDEILELCIKNTDYLISRGCKLIVVACNTATTNAISYLRTHYSIPFVGIEPAIKPAALYSKTGSIGILATKGTLSSALFHKTSDLFAKNINVIEQQGDGIVELIEKGELHSKKMRDLLSNYLQPMLLSDIDHLVLGCTHYPYLIPILKELLPEQVTIIDSGQAVARQTKHLLMQNQLSSKMKDTGSVQMLTNGDPEVLKQLASNKYDVKVEDF